MATRISGVGARLVRRQAVEAVVIRACARCKAPGVYKCDPIWKQTHPRCWVPANNSKVNQSVGPWCPQCGAPRINLTESKGVIWENTIFGSKWGALKYRMKQFFDRRRS